MTLKDALVKKFGCSFATTEDSIWYQACRLQLAYCGIFRLLLLLRKGIEDGGLGMLGVRCKSIAY